MAHWLFKSEPSVWSWDNTVAAGAKGTSWSGVRNHTAKLQMMAMQLGDTGFFYHSGDGKEIVGIVEVCKLFHPDPSDATGKFGMVGAGEGRAAFGENVAGDQLPPVGAASDRRRMETGVQNRRR
jgi:EVE domain